MNKKLLITSIAVLASLFLVNLAQAELMDLWKFSGGALTPIKNFWTIGTSTNRISSIYTTDLDVSGAFTLGGQVDPGPLVIATTSAPSIRWATDTDTGIGTITDDTITLMTGGQHRLFVDTNGNVAIGTTTNAGLFTIGTTSDAIFNITTEGNVGIGTTGPGAKLDVRQTSAGTGIYSYNTATTGTNYGGDLEAVGSGATTNYGLYVGASGATTNYGIYQFAGQNNFLGNTRLGATGTAGYVLDVVAGASSFFNPADGGNSDIYLQADNSSAATKYFTFRVAPDDATNGTLYFIPNSVTTGNAAVTIQSSGNVGIGTTTPSAILHAYTSATTTAIFEQVGPTDEILIAKNATGTVLAIDNAGNLTLDTDTFYVDTANNAVSIATTTYSGLFAIATSTATSSDILFHITTEGDLGVGIPYDNEGRLLYGSDLFYVNTPSGAVTIGTSTSAGVFTVGTTSDPMFNITTEGVARIISGANATLELRKYASNWGTRIQASDYGSGLQFNFDTSDASENWGTRMVIQHGGNVGIGTTTPSTLLQVSNEANATSTITIGAGTSIGCLKMRDTDGAGFTYITALDGVLTASQVACE